MDVSCPQCATVFEFDERQLRSPVITLKCSVCEHLFRVELNLSIQENQTRWMVRQEDTGDILYFNGFDVLHQWIMQQRIKSHDVISRTGQRWTKLADMGELAPVFQVVESINSLSRGRAESEPSLPPLPSRDRVGTIQQFPANAPASHSQEFPRAAPPPVMQPAPPPRPQQPAPAPSPRATGPQPSLPPRPTAPQPALPTSPRQLTPAPSPPPIAEEWSMGGLEEPSAPLYTRKKKSRAPLIITTLITVVGLGAALIYSGYLPVAPLVAPSTTPDTAPDAASIAQVDADAAPDRDSGLEVTSVQKPPQALLDAHFAASGHVFSGVELAQIAQDKTAQEKAREPKRIDPKQLTKQAERALSRDQYQKARELYHQSIQAGDATAENITGLGWALLGLGRVEEAAAQFNRAVFIDNGFEDAYIGLGKAERQRGRLKEALGVYDRYLARFPNGKKITIARYQRDQILKQLGQ